MKTFVALLRGVNVGGKVLKMAELREALGAEGFQKVRTYIQSGNVLFEARGSAKGHASKIEKLIFSKFELTVAVIVKTTDEMKELEAKNPFLKENKEIDPKQLYVTFFSETPSPAAVKALMKEDWGTELFHIVGSTAYLHYPNGYGTAKLTNNIFEKRLKVKATTRNWRTVNQLLVL